MSSLPEKYIIVRELNNGATSSDVIENEEKLKTQILNDILNFGLYTADSDYDDNKKSEYIENLRKTNLKELKKYYLDNIGIISEENEKERYIEESKIFKITKESKESNFLLIRYYDSNTTESVFCENEKQLKDQIIEDIFTFYLYIYDSEYSEFYQETYDKKLKKMNLEELKDYYTNLVSTSKTCGFSNVKIFIVEDVTNIK
jgi:hypothetical protein